MEFSRFETHFKDRNSFISKVIKLTIIDREILEKEAQISWKNPFIIGGKTTVYFNFEFKFCIFKKIQRLF